MTQEGSFRKIGERHAGVVTREDLLKCDLSENQIHLRKKSGEIVPVLPGVFRLGGVPESYRTLLTAVARWMKESGFFCSVTAAHIVALDGVPQPKLIEVARYSRPKSPAWLRIHRLRPEDKPSIRRVGGFRVPMVERVVAECAGALPTHLLGRALDDALRRRLTTLDRMWDFLNDWSRGRRGASTLRKMLVGRDDRDERVRSQFETKMLTILRRIHEHRFEADFELRTRGGRFFLDFYCPEATLGIECHSFRWHMGKHNADVRRHRQVQAAGIEILYFTWDDVCFRARQVEADVRAAIARRSALLFH